MSNINNVACCICLLNLRLYVILTPFSVDSTSKFQIGELTQIYKSPPYQNLETQNQKLLL